MVCSCKWSDVTHFSDDATKGSRFRSPSLSGNLRDSFCGKSKYGVSDGDGQYDLGVDVRDSFPASVSFGCKKCKISKLSTPLSPRSPILCFIPSCQWVVWCPSSSKTQGDPRKCLCTSRSCCMRFCSPRSISSQSWRSPCNARDTHLETNDARFGN
jgi:hypothetical protein